MAAVDAAEVRGGRGVLGYVAVLGDGCMADGRMRFRKLRIAWSVGWGIAAVLLCVLWVRSYSKSEAVWRVTWTPPPATLLHTRFASNSGALSWAYENGMYSLSLQVAERDRWHYQIHKAAKFIPNKFQGHYSKTRILVSIPHWFAVSLCFALCVALRFRWKFSLRTLLIVTTLVAVGLGLLVWTVRSL